MKKIFVNLDERTLTNNLITTEGDNTNEKYTFIFVKNGKRENIENKTIRIALIKEDKKGKLIDLTVTDAKNGEAVLNIDSTLTTEEGDYTCQLAVFGQDGYLEQSILFNAFITKSILKEISGEITNNPNFETLVNTLKEVQENLVKISDWDNYFKEVSPKLEEKYTNRLNDIMQDYTHILEQIGDDEEYGTSKNINESYFKNLQIGRIETFFKKIGKEQVKICCYGDSTTYGYDVSSEDKRNASSPVDGVTFPTDDTRASTTYPEQLEKNLKETFGEDKIIVKNRGYAGDDCLTTWARWNRKHDSDLTIISFGINDAVNARADYMGDLGQFTIRLEQLILRELIWGKAVVGLTAIKQRESNNDVSRLIEKYREVLERVCSKYYIPVLSGTESLKNYNQDIFSDKFHLNGKGYSILGNYVATFFNKKVVDYFKVFGNSYQAVIENEGYIAGNNVDLTSTSDSPNIHEENANKGIASKTFKGFVGKNIFTFETSIDNVVALPLFLTSIEETQENKTNIFYLDDSKILEKQYETINLNTNEIYLEGNDEFGNNTDKLIALEINKRGKHTLKIELVGYCELYGIVFMPKFEYETKFKK